MSVNVNVNLVVKIVMNNLKNLLEDKDTILFQNMPLVYANNALNNENILEIIEKNQEDIIKIVKEIILKNIDIEDFETIEGIRLIYEGEDQKGYFNKMYDVLDIDFELFKKVCIRSFEDLKRSKEASLEIHRRDYLSYVSILKDVIKEAIEEVDEDFLETIKGMTEEEALEIYKLNYTS